MDTSFVWWARLSGSSCLFSGVFIAEDVNGVGDGGSRDTITVDQQTLLEAFLNISLRSACLTEPFFQ